MAFLSYKKSVSNFIILALITIFANGITGWAQDKFQYMGTASCSSSNCHGNSAPIKASEVLQNEFVTWYRHDRHSKAYDVLLNEQSKRIAYNLGIKSAEKDPQCLSCHATYVADEKMRSEKFRVEDGVSCESCHGASSKWLKEHVASDATRQKNISLGMLDLSNLKVKTELCLGCHLGNDDKYVNHRLIGAGHPRLTFEIDTFESVMPRHWEVDKDKYDPASQWIIGQTVQAIERTKALYSKKRSHAGLFPEFTNMHCYSCHHALSQKQYENREYDGRPGEANLNTSELWMLSKSLSIIDKPNAATLSLKLKKLRDSYGKEDISATAQELVAIKRPDTAKT